MSALPGRYVDLIRDGAPPAELRAAVWSTLLAAVRHEWAFADWHREMTDRHNRLGDWYDRRDDTGRPRGGDAVQRKLRAEWDRAVEYAADNPAVTDADFAREVIREYRAAAADPAHWNRRHRRERTAVRDRDVLAALHRIAYARGTLTPYVSVRTLCEGAGVATIQTVARALASLAERGWLTRTEPGNATLPAGYRLRTPARTVTADDLATGGLLSHLLPRVPTSVERPGSIPPPFTPRSPTRRSRPGRSRSE